MYNQSAFMFIQIIVFLGGATIGAGVYYLIREAFTITVLQLLKDHSSEFQTHLSQNVAEINEQFNEYKEYLLQLSDENAIEQKNIFDNFKIINNTLIKFNKDIESSHYTRQALETEIIKLKSIIRRQQNKRKERQ